MPGRPQVASRLRSFLFSLTSVSTAMPISPPDGYPSHAVQFVQIVNLSSAPVLVGREPHMVVLPGDGGAITLTVVGNETLSLKRLYVRAPQASKLLITYA